MISNNKNTDFMLSLLDVLVNFDCFGFAMNTVHSSLRKAFITVSLSGCYDVVFLMNFCLCLQPVKSWDVCDGGWTEIPSLPSVCPHNTQTKAWNLRPGMSLRVETINGRMNDRLITTPTKPAEHNPWGAKGVQLSVTAQPYFLPYCHSDIEFHMQCQFNLC